jgi:hypothetical protein
MQDKNSEALELFSLNDDANALQRLQGGLRLY